MLIAGVAASILATGCATGPSYEEVKQTMPPLRAGEGRIFFLRSSSLVGAAIQPELRIDEEVVGRSRPGGFFYADRKPGSYVASGTTEVETRFLFDLAAGETKYLRSAITIGFLAGRLQLTEDSAANAKGELPSLAYTGEVPVSGPDAQPGAGERKPATLAAAAPAVPLARQVAPAPAVPSRAAQPAEAGPVRMDDLRYLMQPR
ncbi:hypothetical protein CS8_028150 [Cupriavidus sp. 8B]